MNKVDVYRKYGPGYHSVDFKEWLRIVSALDGDVLSPGGVAARYRVTRQAVHAAGRHKCIRYFVSSESGYVAIPIEDADTYWLRLKKNGEPLKRMGVMRA